MRYDSAKRYYVYVWYIKTTNEVFYVGKGSGNRCKSKTRKDNPEFNEITKNFDCDYKIIKDCLAEDDAYNLEIETIAYYRKLGSPLINIQDGGANPPSAKGIPKSAECKKKMSASQKKYIAEHPEVRTELSQRMKSFLKTDAGAEFLRKSIAAKKTDDFRAKQSQRCKAANNTDEYKEKQSEIARKTWKSPEYVEAHTGANNHRAQAVSQYDARGNFIREYATITQAALENGLQISKISAVAKGKRKTTGGYMWKYVDDKRLKNKVSRKQQTSSPCAIPILQFDLTGKFLKEYPSIANAAKSNGYNDRTNIIANLKGKTKTAYGFVWKYKHDNTVRSLESQGTCNDYPGRE